MKCKFCGTAFKQGEDKFCENCGRELPQVADSAESISAIDPQNAGPNTTVGKNSILSNSQINTTNTTNTTTVNNTTIEDDTKKSIVCAVSGKRVLYIDSVCCKGCNKDVSIEFYNDKTRKCENCHQENLTQYKNAFQSAIESGGGIDRQERAELDILAQQLNLTSVEKNLIESEVKNIVSIKSNSEEIGFDDMFEMELAIVKKDLFKKNDLSSALLRLKQIYDQVQTNDEISCFYFLLKAIKSPDMYLVNFEGAVYDEFWENYWLFVAHLSKGDHTKGMICIKKNYTKFPSYKNEIILSEIIYLILRFQLEQSDVFIDTANEKLLMIENMSGNLLTKLYKTNEKLLTSFDYGLLNFVNVSAPDDPGMKEYFNFFVDHLYKIAPALPKTEPAYKNSSNPVVKPTIPEISKVEDSQKLAPKLPIKPLGDLPKNTGSQSITGINNNAPKLPVLPNTVNKSTGLTEKEPKLPKVPVISNPQNLSPKLPQKPSIPTPPPNNKTNLPKIPPVPGKK